MTHWPCRPFTVAAVLAALLPSVGHALALQDYGTTFLTQQKSSGKDIPSTAEIKAKWDNMDEFLRIMFTMACKWKHGKDVQGLKAHLMNANDLSAQEGVKVEKEIHAKSLKGLTSACGSIVAQGKGKCRQSCADRWGKALQQRSECDEKCVTTYSRFEAKCKGQVDNLEKVYEMKQTMAQSRTRCFKGHCADFPTVWTRTDEANMTEELGSRCEVLCAADQLKVRCERKWQLEVDFLRDSIRSECHAKGPEGDCFKANRTTLSTEHDTCVSEGEGTCDEQFTSCKAGHADGGVAASEDFCSNRKTMCLEQVAKHCLSDHDRALTAAKAGCEKYGAEALETCEEEMLSERETEEIQKCIDTKTPQCPKDCEKKCDIAGMNGCLAKLGTQVDPAQEFCGDFWELLHRSSEIDPMTGDPIVLLSKLDR
mmetsp:Transcript_111256/g.278536  ORF Transcript_111256/g.278536 Transcript_111256/m.278536 type:complete len:425 (-) Transcript_111256:22-1296(-)